MTTLETELIAEIGKLRDEPGQVPMQNEKLIAQNKRLLQENEDVVTKLESLLSSCESLKTQYNWQLSKLASKYGLV